MKARQNERRVGSESEPAEVNNCLLGLWGARAALEGG
jgi:hypothetical protein